MTDIQTSDRDVNRAIRSWLHEDRHEDASRLAGAVLDQVEATPQRRSLWWPARRTPTMSKFVTIGVGAAAVVIALFVGVQVIGPPVVGPGSPATPTPEPARVHLFSDGILDGLPITVAVATPRWAGDPNGGGLCWGDPADTCAGPPDGAGLFAFHGDQYRVYGDACHRPHRLAPDTIATTVDELVAAVANQAHRYNPYPGQPEDIRVDGYAGKRVILRLEDGYSEGECDDGIVALFGLPGTNLARSSQRWGQIEELWVIDVDGLIVVLDGVYWPDTMPSVVDELRAILASATFGAP